MTQVPSLIDTPELAGRYDLYGIVHKGLRKAQCALLGRLGTADFENSAETAELLADLRALLALAASHVEHEDRHIHLALRNHAAASTERLDDQHEDHRQAFLQLEELALGLERALPKRKAAAGRKLYLAFSAYVGDDLLHMYEEETVTAPLLWALFSDAELQAIEMAILGSLPPEKNMAFLRIMIPAISRDERAAMLGGMKNGVPPQIFNAVIEFAARPNLTADDFADLSGRLGLAA